MSRTQAVPLVPVSWGELLDKITILEIKQQRIASSEARANVARELHRLTDVAGPAMARRSVAPLLGRLKAVNEDLWEIEDSIREREAHRDFGSEFVRLARAVYKKNDQRAAIKRRLNLLLGSELIEEKSYAAAPSVSPKRASADSPCA